MTDEKRTALKETIKLKTLAALAEINQSYLSDIINNKKQCSKRLAEDLAFHANSLVNSSFFTAEDFLN
jgi:hypothetical protein